MLQANLLENYCPSMSLAANPYPPDAQNMSLNLTVRFEDYVERYAQEVQPDLLCTDYYPYFESRNRFPFGNRLNDHTEGHSQQSMENYLQNILVLRAAGLRHNLSWWNYFGAAAFQGHTMVTEIQMRVQMAASITAGARGLLYWIIGKADPNGWATVSPRLGRHWAQAKRLNTHILALGPTLMQLRSDSVLLIRANATPGLATAGAAGGGGVVTLVQEAVGCSTNTPLDIINPRRILMGAARLC